VMLGGWEVNCRLGDK